MVAGVWVKRSSFASQRRASSTCLEHEGHEAMGIHVSKRLASKANMKEVWVWMGGPPKTHHEVSAGPERVGGVWRPQV
jgi:hypothetical protein